MFLNIVPTFSHVQNKCIFFTVVRFPGNVCRKAYSDSICPVRVQQKTNTELLSLLMPGMESGGFPFILPPTVYNLVKNYNLLFFFLTTNLSFILVFWKPGVYLSFAQHAAYSWNRSFCPLSNVKMPSRRVNQGVGVGG